MVSAAPVLTTGAGERALYRATIRPLLRTVFRDAYDDLAEMERLLAASAVDWTVLRPPNLTNKPGSGHYRTAAEANILDRYSIARVDLAQAMLDVVEDPATYRHALGVAAAPRTSRGNVQRQQAR